MHYLDMATDKRPLTIEPTNKHNNQRKALLFKTKLNGWINKTFDQLLLIVEEKAKRKIFFNNSTKKMSRVGT